VKAHTKSAALRCCGCGCGGAWVSCCAGAASSLSLIPSRLSPSSKILTDQVVRLEDWNTGTSKRKNFDWHLNWMACITFCCMKAEHMSSTFKTDHASQTPLIVHHLPCDIELDGTASVSSYFVSRNVPIEHEHNTTGDRIGTVVVIIAVDILENASFRGRRLLGKEVQIPSGYSGNICFSILLC